MVILFFDIQLIRLKRNLGSLMKYPAIEKLVTLTVVTKASDVIVDKTTSSFATLHDAYLKNLLVVGRRVVGVDDDFDQTVFSALKNLKNVWKIF